jgi:hypothetical protein
MPRSKKKSSRADLPGGSELEAIAWGYHMAKGARGELIAQTANQNTFDLMTDTGRPAWVSYTPELELYLPKSKGQVLKQTPVSELARAFGKGVYDHTDEASQNKALVNLSGGTHKTHGKRVAIMGDGTQLMKSEVFTRKVKDDIISASPVVKAKRETRANKRVVIAELESDGTDAAHMEAERLAQRNADAFAEFAKDYKMPPAS